MIFKTFEPAEMLLAKNAKAIRDKYNEGFNSAFDDAYQSELKWQSVTEDNPEDDCDLPKSIGDLHSEAQQALAYAQGRLEALRAIVAMCRIGESNPDWVKRIQSIKRPTR